MEGGRNIAKYQYNTLKVMMCRFIYKERKDRKINKKMNTQGWIHGITTIHILLFLATPTRTLLNQV